MNSKSITFLIALSVITTFWVVITIYALKFTLPYNAVALPFNTRVNSTVFRAILPEGFAFFTRNPREQQVTILKLTGNEFQIEKNVNGSIENLLGLKKTARSRDIEMATLISQISESEWLSCKSQLNECATHPETPILFLENKYANPLLCGEYLIVLRNPVPWAWAKSMNSNAMPTLFVRIKVGCR